MERGWGGGRGSSKPSGGGGGDGGGGGNNHSLNLYLSLLFLEPALHCRLPKKKQTLVMRLPS